MVSRLDVQEWIANAAPEERFHYSSVLGIDTELRKLMNDYMSWIFEEEYHNTVITLDYILGATEMFVDIGWIDESRADRIRSELYKLNFGSMLISF